MGRALDFTSHTNSEILHALVLHGACLVEFLAALNIVQPFVLFLDDAEDSFLIFWFHAMPERREQEVLVEIVPPSN